LKYGGEAFQEGSFKMKRLGYLTEALAVLSTVLFIGPPLSAQGQGGASAALSERAKHGKDIFNVRCYVCHDRDSNRVKLLGPSLDGLFKKKTLIVGKPVSEDNVKEVIKTGPTPGMPSFRYSLSDQEIGDVVEFLKTK
jgi:mono/diheme cytochrome c family protein